MNKVHQSNQKQANNEAMELTKDVIKISSDQTMFDTAPKDSKRGIPRPHIPEDICHVLCYQNYTSELQNSGMVNFFILNSTKINSNLNI